MSNVEEAHSMDTLVKGPRFGEGFLEEATGTVRLESTMSRRQERQKAAMEKRLTKPDGTRPSERAAAARRAKTGNKRFTPKAGTR